MSFFVRFITVFLFCSLPSSIKALGQTVVDVSINDIIGVLAKDNKYEIKEVVDLEGNNLIIPKDCILFFNGGKITNGTVVFSNTKLEGDICVEGGIKGTIANGEINASWFGLKAGSKEDQTKTLQSIIDLYQNNVSHNSWDINLLNPEPAIFIPSGRYYVGAIKLRSYVTIKGAGRGSSELRGVTFYANGQFNFSIENLSLVGNIGASKATDYNLDNTSHSSAFILRDCARLIFRNVSIKNYNVAFDNYNTYLVDLYSCFISYCNVCYLNDGKGGGYGGHAVRWYGGEMCESKYGFVQKNGNGVLLNGATIEACQFGIDFIYPVSFTVDACYFENNNYDIYGTVVHVNILNNFFSETGKVKGNAYIYAPTAIGFTIIQGNKFGKPIFDNPHIMIDDKTQVYGNITIGQNDIVHGGRIPVSERLLSSIVEKGTNTYQTYLPDGKSMLMGQTIIYKEPSTGKFFLVTRDTGGNLLSIPFEKMADRK